MFINYSSNNFNELDYRWRITRKKDKNIKMMWYQNWFTIQWFLKKSMNIPIRVMTMLRSWPHAFFWFSKIKIRQIFRVLAQNFGFSRLKLAQILVF